MRRQWHGLKNSVAMMADNDWAELHGYVYYECRECGWRGYSDGGGPDCECGPPTEFERDVANGTLTRNGEE
ncbi:hypothetical protein LCGC14_1835530 [marine sediment metagenome]|uniref:Uncharacterized protein n=1 Tax=marine sediment metagenome TaxID=412755 RepID=A0A0F9GF12_9ZZZZ